MGFLVFIFYLEFSVDLILHTIIFLIKAYLFFFVVVISSGSLSSLGIFLAPLGAKNLSVSRSNNSFKSLPPRMKSHYFFLRTKIRRTSSPSSSEKSSFGAIVKSQEHEE